MKRIVLIDGHPDPNRHRLVHALADAYEKGATESGHFVHRINIADLQIPLLRTPADFYSKPPPSDIRSAQRALIRGDHLVVIFPLWLGAMPALLSAFFEQLFRRVVAFSVPTISRAPHNPLKGKSGRIIVTMNMSARRLRGHYGSLPFQHAGRTSGWMGLRPVRSLHIDRVEALSESQLARVLERVRILGRDAK